MLLERKLTSQGYIKFDYIKYQNAEKNSIYGKVNEYVKEFEQVNRLKKFK